MKALELGDSICISPGNKGKGFNRDLNFGDEGGVAIPRGEEALQRKMEIFGT